MKVAVRVARTVCIVSACILLAGMDFETKDQRCRRYADDAVRQFQESEKRGCGFRGDRWHANRDAHYSWCMTRGEPFEPNREDDLRREALKSCPDKECEAYARSAVRQQADNGKFGCNYTGNAWSDRFDYHFNWCNHGDNRRNIERETQARNRELLRCQPNVVLDGDVSIKTLQVNVRGTPKNRYIASVGIELETDSTTPWKFGDYGHTDYGSLWAELTVTGKIWQSEAHRVGTRTKTYLFSIRGHAAQTLPFEPEGWVVGRGKQTVRLVVKPMPRIPLTGVEMMFKKSSPLSPGGVGCVYAEPEVTAKVYIVRKDRSRLQFKPVSLQTVMRSKTAVPPPDATYVGVDVDSRGGVTSTCRWLSMR